MITDEDVTDLIFEIAHLTDDETPEPWEDKLCREATRELLVEIVTREIDKRICPCGEIRITCPDCNGAN